MEKDERYEVNSNGELVVGTPVTLTSSERKMMIEKLFSINGWVYTLIKEITNCHYLIQLKNNNLGIENQYHLYHGNIRKEDPERNREEKKIQLGTENDPRQNFDNALILGFYVYENKLALNDIVVVAWPVEEGKNYPANPSLRVNMRTDIQVAKNIGYYIDSITGKRIVSFRPEFIYQYLESYKQVQYSKQTPQVQNSEEEPQSLPSVPSILLPSLNFKTNLPSDFQHNRIIFGAPGTGKSFKLSNERKDLLDENNEVDYERVTFHPDYSYANFVGTYKPVMVGANLNKIDNETKSILNVLKDKNKTAQDKYNELYDCFKNDSLTRLPILLGICSDETFQTKKKDASDAANSNVVERNHGVAIRQFVKLIDDETNKSSGEIAYEYVPGPFMRMYVKALKNAQTDKPRPFLLIIEEINRANVAGVFGDIFQLLDRDDNNVSEYPIQASEDIKKYLAKEFNRAPEDFAQIRIPDNLFIWATMNSADQGVFPMDTAFKRRWDFTYLGINDNASEIAQQFVVLNNGSKVYWNGIRIAINDYLAKIGVNEDKHLGPYFLKKDVISDTRKFCEVFKHKIIMYLFEDAAKQKRASLFSGFEKENLRYSIICEEFDRRGIEIFNKEIQDKCTKYDPAKHTSTNEEES